MEGINGASRNNERLAGVVKIFQVRKHLVETHRDEAKNVLAKDPLGSCLRYDASHFRPDRSVIFRASSLPGLRVWLARKSPGKDICPSELFPIKVEDVIEGRDSGEVFCEDSLGIGISLAEGNGLESCPLCGKRESSDSGEEVEMRGSLVIHLTPFLFEIFFPRLEKICSFNSTTISLIISSA